MSDDGVALTSAAHPRAPWYRRVWLALRAPRLSPESLETIYIDPAKHASAPQGYLCADCTMCEDACPLCYKIWWQRRNPHVHQM
jgi:ferredoxin